MPSLSARLQSVENSTSHSPKFGVPPPIFATLAFAPNRQEQYLPVVFSSLDSHSPAGASAHALAASNRTPAKVTVAVVIALVFMALPPIGCGVGETSKGGKSVVLTRLLSGTTHRAGGRVAGEVSGREGRGSKPLGATAGAGSDVAISRIRPRSADRPSPLPRLRPPRRPPPLPARSRSWTGGGSTPTASSRARGGGVPTSPSARRAGGASRGARRRPTRGRPREPGGGGQCPSSGRYVNQHGCDYRLGEPASGEVVVHALPARDPLAIGSNLRARRQERLAHQVRVHPARRLPPFPDRPHDQRLPAPCIPAREHARHRRLVVGPGLHVAALGQRAAELGDDRVGLGAEEAERQEDEVAVELELAARHLLHDGAAVVLRPRGGRRGASSPCRARRPRSASC